jgi:hypothetical protein
VLPAAAYPACSSLPCRTAALLAPPTLQGVEAALPAVREAYAAHGAADNFQLYVEPGCDHCCTEGMWEQVTAFMDKHLLLEQQGQQGQGGGAGGQLAVAATDG